MADDSNPYQSPDAPVMAEDFIAFEPRRKSSSSFVAAVTCFGVSGLLLIIEVSVGLNMYTDPSQVRRRPFEILLFAGPILYATLAFLFAGRAFWLLRDRRGLFLFLTGFAALVFFVSLPWLLPPTQVQATVAK